MWIIASLLAVVVAAVLFLDVGAPKIVVRATVVESRFQAERGEINLLDRPGNDQE